MKNSQQELPKILVLMGHPRSGTTILNRVCNSHPQIAMTREFSNLILPQPFMKHVFEIRKNFLRKNPIIYAPVTFRRMKLLSILFLFRYLFWLFIYSRGYITTDAMQKTLHRLYPEEKIVGDKKPAYVWQLSNFSQPNTYYVLIYRDGRDVVQSALNRTWGKSDTRFSNAKKTAKKWMSAIEIMEKHHDHLHIIRYEDLVANPQEVLTSLAEYLNVTPDGFKPEMVKGSSVGKYKDMLTQEQLAVINKIAGPTLDRLGYD